MSSLHVMPAGEAFMAAARRLPEARQHTSGVVRELPAGDARLSSADRRQLLSALLFWPGQQSEAGVRVNTALLANG